MGRPEQDRGARVGVLHKGFYNGAGDPAEIPEPLALVRGSAGEVSLIILSPAFFRVSQNSDHVAPLIRRLMESSGMAILLLANFQRF